jgi:hypothetical protein
MTYVSHEDVLSFVKLGAVKVNKVKKNVYTPAQRFPDS